jgi:hypothetical protein
MSGGCLKTRKKRFLYQVKIFVILLILKDIMGSVSKTKPN